MSETISRSTSNEKLSNELLTTSADDVLYAVVVPGLYRVDRKITIVVCRKKHTHSQLTQTIQTRAHLPEEKKVSKNGSTNFTNETSFGFYGHTEKNYTIEVSGNVG